MQTRTITRPRSASTMTRKRPATAATSGVLVVSNRLPVTLSRSGRGLEARPSPGGLVTALEPVLRRRGGTWIGWPGTELRRNERLPHVDLPYRIDPVGLSDTEVTRYYYGFSNRALWPLLHSMMERARFDPREWDTYELVNARFAERAAAAAAGADFVWVHDYHLLRTPRHLRRLLPDGRIAFFLHTPFPPYDVFRILPWAREILRGLLGCDLVGFHVRDYALNFIHCVERMLAARVDCEKLLIEEGDRTIRVGAFPLGIDFERFEELAKAAPETARTRERVVLGVDRLDYTKGIPNRIRAFDRLLELHPEYREQITLVQIAVPTRSQVSEYRALKREIDELVGQVNGRFGTAAWAPIRYLYRGFPHERLAALYRDAEVALVTPLRDGMNLVAKEFVACQVEQPGVLVLSHLAGTAETMHEAIRVNPYDVEETANALDRALTMGEPERLSRLAALRKRERRDNVYAWVEKFVAAALGTAVGLRPPTADDFGEWLGAFLAGYHLALFVSHDGALAASGGPLLPASVERGLAALASRPDSDITLMSGRSLDDIQSLTGDLPVTVAAHDGLVIAAADLEPFRHVDIDHCERRTSDLTERLSALATGTGAWAEDKGASVTFHCGDLDPRPRAALLERARAIVERAGFQARNTPLGLEARLPIGFDRGQAALHVLRMRYGPAWSETVRVIYVGHDAADEEAFRVFTELGFTFRVGSAETQTLARRRLPNLEAVAALLDWLALRPAAVKRTARA
jgi:trehalose 6-phosphate synthase/phosphatase